MVAWVGFEMIRATFIPVIATSAFIGYTQATQPWVIQPVSIFSVYGLGLVIMLMQLRPGARCDGFARPQMDGAGCRPGGFAFDLALADRHGRDPAGVGRPQPGYPEYHARHAKSSCGERRGPISHCPLSRIKSTPHRSASIRLPNRRVRPPAQGARIIYTPEMMFNFDPQVEYTEQFRSLAKETNAYLFITYAVGIEGQPWRNEVGDAFPGWQVLAGIWQKPYLDDRRTAHAVGGRVPGV